MKTENKYIKIKEVKSSDKTKWFDIVNQKGNYVIGEIYWYPSWRQYCFFPYEDMVFNDTCLELVLDFLKEINIKHRSNWKQKKEEGINEIKKPYCSHCKSKGWIVGLETPCPYCNPGGEWRAI